MTRMLHMVNMSNWADEDYVIETADGLITLKPGEAYTSHNEKENANVRAAKSASPPNGYEPPAWPADIRNRVVAQIAAEQREAEGSESPTDATDGA